MISEKAYDEHVDQLFDVLGRVTSALREAGIEYRLVGGLAIFLTSPNAIHWRPA